jgi:hypothetical protein
MDGWVANLSDGSTHVEQWVPGYLSPWQRLIEYCKKNHCYVTNLRLTVGKKTFACPSNAKGYWQAHAMPSVQSVECDEELHKWRGIGWVEGDTVQIVWAARDPITHQVVAWRDTRPAKNQGQIIWAIPEGKYLVAKTLGEQEVPHSDAKVRKLNKYVDRIIAE